VLYRFVGCKSSAKATIPKLPPEGVTNQSRWVKIGAAAQAV